MNKRYNTTKEANKKRRALIILIIIVALIAAAFLSFRWCFDPVSDEKPKETPTYIESQESAIDGKAQAKNHEEILKELEKQQLVVTDRLSSNITFSSGEVGTVGKWIVENPEENNIIQQAEVYLNGVLIAKSSPIYPNQHITEVSLLERIESGEYEVTAYLNYYDIETKEFISRAGYSIHLTVR